MEMGKTKQLVASTSRLLALEGLRRIRRTQQLTMCVFADVYDRLSPQNPTFIAE